METVVFLEALVRALGRGWSARYGLIAPYGVFGLVLTSDAGGAIEVVPSLVRGDIVVWSPFPFARGVPHYDLHIDGALIRTRTIADAIARLETWRRAQGPVGKLTARIARGRRPVRPSTTDGKALMRSPLVKSVLADQRARAPESLADALRGQKLGEIDRARKLARSRDSRQAARELIGIARRARGADRANALGVLVAVAGPEHGPELARYLADPERAVQSAAVDGVKRTGYTAAIPQLAALVVARDRRPTSARSQLAASAAAAMKALSGKRGAAALTGLLTADDPRVREAACVAYTLLAGPDTKRARALLQQLLTDDDPRVVRAARRALAER